VVTNGLNSDRIARDFSSSPSSGEDTLKKMEDYGEADVSSQVQRGISSEVKKAMESSQNQIVNSTKAMIDSNFKNFQSSMETTQKELSTAQLAKIEENVFGSYKFKRHGNEANTAEMLKSLPNSKKQMQI
jgi:glycerate-2-kinase